MKRKSPMRHRVKGHVRDGMRVHSYIRGSGSSSRRSALHGTELRRYNVEFTYPEGKKESVKVIASNTPDAFLNAYHHREHTDLRPTKVVAKNELGDIIDQLKTAHIAMGPESFPAVVEAYKVERGKT